MTPTTEAARKMVDDMLEDIDQVKREVLSVVDRGPVLPGDLIEELTSSLRKSQAVVREALLQLLNEQAVELTPERRLKRAS